MSCQSSAQPLQPAHNPAALAQALVTVAERSFFAYAEPAAPEQVAAATGGWYEASVSFHGSFSGRVMLTLPADLARELWASFLGLESDAVADDVATRDLVGELANMVCGTWLTALSETSCFELAPPVVRATDATPAADVVVTVNEQPVAIALLVRSGDR
jgi:hypothetical protein